MPQEKGRVPLIYCAGIDARTAHEDHEFIVGRSSCGHDLASVAVVQRLSGNSSLVRDRELRPRCLSQPWEAIRTMDSRRGKWHPFIHVVEKPAAHRSAFLDELTNEIHEYLLERAYAAPTPMAAIGV